MHQPVVDLKDARSEIKHSNGRLHRAQLSSILPSIFSKVSSMSPLTPLKIERLANHKCFCKEWEACTATHFRAKLLGGGWTMGCLDRDDYRS